MNHEDSIDISIPEKKTVVTDVTVAISEADLIESLQHECVTFLAFYLGSELYMKVPEFHEEIWSELLAMVKHANIPGISYNLKKLFAVPRGFSKSTLAKLAVILFLKYTPLQFVVYASKTNGIAKNAILDILSWLESPQETALHGPTIRTKSSETESLWIIEMGIRLHVGSPPVRKICIFKALGAEQQIRGMLRLNKRPQIMVVDDFEDNDNTATPSSQHKLDAWIMGAFLKAADANRSIVILIGNMLRETSFLARACTLKEWNPTVYGCLVKDAKSGEIVSLWPEKHPKKQLLAEYKMFKQLGTGHIWEAEMMNLTHESILSADFGDVIRPMRPIKEKLDAGFLCIDPAYGKKSWNDETAITVHVRVHGFLIPVVIDSRHGHWDEAEIFEELLDLTMLWGITTWCIESEAAQRLYIPLFKLMFFERGMRQDVVTILPLTTGKKAKASRILAFRTAVICGSYAIAEEEEAIMELLKNYNAESSEHDDMLDSCAYGTLVWALYNETVMSQGIRQVLDFAITGNEMAPADLVQGISIEGW